MVNQLGLMIRSTLEASLGKQYATLMSQLVRMAKDSVTQLDAQVRCLAQQALSLLWPLTVQKGSLMLRRDRGFLFLLRG